ncbi:MAG TPA: AzlD domain-containing protein [Desulfobacteraceae bacterium]|nr:AzlD domain-containing protein [Desulfobacteraceae bacterium]|tara:strand:+ start:1162 stop:1473 length:312 start_codon:yes stop_codon:yes gene_type:complete
MDKSSFIPLILGMAAATYLPRLAPFMFFSDMKVPRVVDAFLKSIPVAAIGALIVPSALTATPDMPAAGLMGMGFTLVYGLFRGGIIVPVLGSVGVAYLVMTFG